jgi:hypothetical protein
MKVRRSNSTLSANTDKPLRVYLPDECGEDGYPLAWHETIKHAVREAAGHRCVRCLHPYVCGESPGEWSACDARCTHKGPVRLSYTADDGSCVHAFEHELATEAAVVVGYGKRVEARYRILTVHHLDGDKRNCRWWNLAALCQRCHLQIQGKVRMDRRWPHEHSEWFKPYVAGYYAHTYRGEDLSREEAVARLDELLALEVRQESLL